MAGVFKILVLSDSLTLPRNKGGDQVLVHEETWPQLLSSRHDGLEVVSQAIGSATTEDILYQSQYWKGHDADLVIFQVGICDALPRAFRKFELEFIKLLPFHEFWNRITSKVAPCFRKHRSICLVSDCNFSKNLEALNEVFPKCLFLGIVHDSTEPERLPGAYQRIERYNKVLKEVAGAGFVDLSLLPDSALMSDHFHLRPSGHEYIYRELCSRIESFSLLPSTL